MSPIDTDEGILSEDTAGHTNSDVDNLKLVPVAESIRYRKRAQSAEKKIEALAEQLREAKSETTKMAEQLSSIEVEGQTQAGLDGVVEQLKREKQYLFTGSSGAVTAKKTAGAKDRIQNSQTILERAAKKAAMTGSRTDLQDYLKLRRNFI